MKYNMSTLDVQNTLVIEKMCVCVSVCVCVCVVPLRQSCSTIHRPLPSNTPLPFNSPAFPASNASLSTPHCRVLP